MPIFEIYNLDESLQLNLSSRLTKYLGTVTINLFQSGSISDPRFLNGTPWYCLTVLSADFSLQTISPTISVNGTVLSWTSGSAGSGQKTPWHF